jgi:hypothetical protein
MKRIFTLVLALAAGGMVHAASWETSSLRTASGGLVRIGMPSQEALHVLGGDAKRAKTGKTGRKTEVWTYRGSDGVYRITISGGQVRKIVVTPDRD